MSFSLKRRGEESVVFGTDIVEMVQDIGSVGSVNSVRFSMCARDGVKRSVDSTS